MKLHSYITLVLILHRYEQAFLTSVIGFNPAKHFWIGLSDTEEEGTFKWASGDTVIFTHWNVGMPGRHCRAAAPPWPGMQNFCYGWPEIWGLEAIGWFWSSAAINVQKQPGNFCLCSSGWIGNHGSPFKRSPETVGVCWYHSLFVVWWFRYFGES